VMAAIESVIILGAGSWGTALASVMAQTGKRVQLWGRDAGLMRALGEDGENRRYLPGVRLPEGILFESELEALQAADAVFWVVPSGYLRALVERAGALPWAQAAGVWVSCSKGIELSSGMRMTEVMREAGGGGLPCAVLTGPNHAEEVARGLATAAVVACEDEAVAIRLQAAVSCPWLRCYRTADVAGAEWGGALKNPYALAAGMAKGLSLGDNAIAALVTRSLAEMVRFGVVMGGRAETFYGLSGVGDLVTTCYSSHSRNHRLGVALGRGEKLADLLRASSMVAEGVPNTKSLYEAARRAGVRVPLLNEIFAVLYEEKPPALALRDLLARDVRAEGEG
jgi:glycerol-3-phosphate dehydrogenase (NAD(P)+)